MLRVGACLREPNRIQASHPARRHRHCGGRRSKCQLIKEYKARRRWRRPDSDDADANAVKRVINIGGTGTAASAAYVG